MNQINAIVVNQINAFVVNQINAIVVNQINAIVVNQTCTSTNGGLLEITCTVPLTTYK